MYLHEIIHWLPLVYHTNGIDLLMLPCCLHRPARVKRNMQLLMPVHSSNKSSAPHGPLLFCRKPGIQYGETSKGNSYLLGRLIRGLGKKSYFFLFHSFRSPCCLWYLTQFLQSPSKFSKYRWVQGLPSTELGWILFIISM